MNPLLTVEEVARMLFCSKRRVFELLADGTLVRAKKFGRKTVIVADSVYAALEAAQPADVPRPRRRLRGRAALALELDQALEQMRAG